MPALLGRCHRARPGLSLRRTRATEAGHGFALRGLGADGLVDREALQWSPVGRRERRFAELVARLYVCAGLRDEKVLSVLREDPSRDGGARARAARGFRGRMPAFALRSTVADV